MALVTLGHWFTLMLGTHPIFRIRANDLTWHLALIYLRRTIASRYAVIPIFTTSQSTSHRQTIRSILSRTPQSHGLTWCLSDLSWMSARRYPYYRGETERANRDLIWVDLNTAVQNFNLVEETFHSGGVVLLLYLAFEYDVLITISCRSSILAAHPSQISSIPYSMQRPRALFGEICHMDTGHAHLLPRNWDKNVLSG
jgi:hypothetical protein